MRGVGVTVGAGTGPARAARLRRPTWRDPRLAVGAVLVLASVALGTSVVAAADDTVAVYAAGDTLVPGTPLSGADLNVVRVRVDGQADLYLPVADGFAEPAVALRTVGAGEIVPRSAVGSPDALTRRPVTVPVEGVVPADLVPGAVVDVWIAATDAAAGGPAATPEKALAGIEVYSVDTEGGGLGTIAAASVAVLLDDDGTARVLGALANGHRVDLVPVPGSMPGRP